MNQPTAYPTRKVATAGASGAAAVVIVWALSLFGVDVPDPVGAAFAVLIAFGGGYLVPERPAHGATPTP